MYNPSRTAQFAATPYDFRATEPQLPIHSYCDPAIYECEQELIFRHCANYIGHEKMVPELGDWYALPHEEHSRILVRNEHGVELLSNVCRHRQALMLGDFSPGSDASTVRRGNLRATGNRIMCPLHAWTYDTSGLIVGAPKFPQKPCRNLPRYPLNNVAGFLFEGPRDPVADIGALFRRPDMDFSDYQLDHVEMHPCKCNWKTFIEIYNDDYHIVSFHPGLRRYVRSEGLQWDYGDWYSLQRINVNPNLARAGTDTYRAWHEGLMAVHGDAAPDFGAIWASYYPTHMIEVFPHALVLSTVYPKGVHECLNVVEFYYPQALCEGNRELVEAHRAAYMETAIEDDEIAERTDAGRRALYQRGVDDSGPYQIPLEEGMQHFHGWYRQVMGQALAAERR
ncbi:Rieske (2Fe-2S) protein [Pseudomonas sp. YY-1]|uniref:aromatic ring-hydroxylating oxygenase subunit alpha n=1 Tax=Pseudomonas sp. YY-1 TaxID=2058659 RepID=UPI000CBC64A2|nr:aromatic ring-hydroxylating dioxygenase subunit alpha [Pseudomonas sp. YY-1]PKQ40651.1 Rieske (2Fe-2S) protein [Pseudomonas sp. YY-1]